MNACVCTFINMKNMFAVSCSLRQAHLVISNPFTGLFFYIFFCFASQLLKYTLDKMIGLGSDGASNMVGSKGGLATLLKQDIGEHFVNVHCFSHRLELAFRDAVKKNKLYEKLMTLLIGVYYFYTKQYKNKKGLMSAFEVIKVKPHMPPKVTGTRWLPHMKQGIAVLLRNFNAYNTHMSDASHTNAKAEGLVKIMLDKHVLTFALFMQKLLEPLCNLQEKLQRQDITLADAMAWIETTMELVMSLETSIWK
ncbi:uncharacterized protein LOC132757589 [Ruditapes philippinarum]|uniref:uncharacterized protein LOC132757589 n=1 Tax=Ruditapes philippinarum TaxID=129788 RepID=UPI00295C1470|nr:uncharacterized protein LOC132757589 [Ruditapes philippinarum]